MGRTDGAEPLEFLASAECVSGGFTVGSPRPPLQARE